MFEVSVEHSFAAGHALRGYKGKCENIHGHNYRVRVVISGEKLNPTGLLMDFADVRRKLRAMADSFDHQFLNDMVPFRQVNPSAENLACYFARELGREIEGDGLCVSAVTVWETDSTSATYYPPKTSQ